MLIASESEWRQSHVRKEGVASVCLIVGGAFQGLTQYPEAAAADLVIYADVQSEVAGMAEGSSAPLLTLRLASGETLGTLTQLQCPPGLKQFLAERSGVNLNVGLGQLRVVGALVAQQLIADPAFKEFMVKEVFERLLQLHNGCLEHIEVQIVTSIAGGTGSAVGPVIGKSVVQVLLEFSNATVHSHTVRAGSLGFSGLGDRVHVNGAATLAEDVDYVLDGNRQMWVKILTFHSQVNVRSQWTKDMHAASETFKGIRADGGTALFKTVMHSVDEFRGRVGHKYLLLFTDGKDTDGGPDVESLISICKKEGIVISTIGLRSDDLDVVTLRRLAGDTGGTYAEADGPQQLLEQFRQTGARVRPHFYRLVLRSKDHMRAGMEIRIGGDNSLLLKAQ